MKFIVNNFLLNKFNQERTLGASLSAELDRPWSEQWCRRSGCHPLENDACRIGILSKKYWFAYLPTDCVDNVTKLMVDVFVEMILEKIIPDVLYDPESQAIYRYFF